MYGYIELLDEFSKLCQNHRGGQPFFLRNKRRIITAALNSTIGVRRIKKNLNLNASKSSIYRVLLTLFKTG